MKKITIYLMMLAVAFLLGSCSEESKPLATEDLGIPGMFSPGEDADPAVKSMYKEYGLWVRMWFAEIDELTNAILAEDEFTARFGAENLEVERRPEVIKYSETLLSNVSKEYTNRYFPLEFFFVKSYGRAPYWDYDLKQIGRSRLVICWPNELAGVIPVTDPENHYYQDSVLTTNVWANIATMITMRMEEPIADFGAAGKAYDNGKANDQIYQQYQKDEDEAKYEAAINDLCVNGGFLSGKGSAEFRSDFADWIKLLATESYENIKRNYLDNSKARANKYEIAVKFFKEHNWDIQAAGNKFRQKFDEYKATLPPVPDEGEEDE